MIVDAHQHFWQLSRTFDYRWLDAPANAAIRRDYLPEHLEPLLRSRGISRSVFVQTQHDVAENRWVLELAEQHPFLAGVVGWVDLASPECESQVAEFRQHAKFVGVRHLVHNEPDDDWLIRPDVLRGLGVLEKHRVPFDLLLFVKHLRHVPTLARRFPDLPLVIDHLAKPRIRERVVADWLPDFRAAAQFPNVWCKLSGMITEADHRAWKPDDLTPYVDAALEAFGPSRLMYGSDWPVCELAGTYGQAFDALTPCLAQLSAAERARVLGGSAIAFYGLAAS